MNSPLRLFALAGCVLAAIPAFGQPERRAVRAITTPQGTFLVNSSKPLHVQGTGSVMDASWTSLEPVSVPESCALSPFTGSAWVGEWLNNERLQRFLIEGTGTPVGEFFGTHALFNPAATAAAQNADLAVFMDQLAQNGTFKFYAFHAATFPTPAWTKDIPANFTNSSNKSLRVSRDGSVVAVAFWDPVASSSVVYFYRGSDGFEINRWTGTEYIGGIDLTDNGSLALLTAGQYARLIETSTAVEKFSTPGSGGGGWYNISGNGDVLVVGGFSFQVYKKSGATYNPIINFNAPTSWFSWGSAVSRDGSTVGALSHDYGAGYLNTSVRIWDVASTTLLGTVTTTGTGGLQDSAVYGVMSDNGQVFAVASWGAEDNNHPEVRVFNRNVQLIDSIDTPGSPFGLDLSGDGQHVLAGSKSVHANTFGNGGQVDLLKHAITQSCYANCDNSTSPPILNVNDFNCFLNRYAAGESYANCDGSTNNPLLTVNDFQCFLNTYAAGCS